MRALFSERESHAVYFLQEQDINRLDVVNYISHGIAKYGDFAREVASYKASEHGREESEDGNTAATASVSRWPAPVTPLSDT